ncbi:MAG: DinB family protein, partial [Segetibacter sp.]
YDDVSSQILELFSSFNGQQINIIPFKGSWTAAQVADHIAKATTSIAGTLTAPGKIADREPDERVEEMKDLFLDFEKKFKSPEFILPRQGSLVREALSRDLKKSIEAFKNAAKKANLSEIITDRALGEMTKLELIYLSLYHTQRHIHQLKNIFDVVGNK